MRTNSTDNIVVGAGGFDIKTLAIPEDAKLVLDPIKTPFYVWGTDEGSFTVGEGAKIALRSAYSGMTLGRIVLLTYRDTTVTLPANLNDLFDASSIASGATFAATCETFANHDGDVKQLVLTVGNYDSDAKEIVVMSAGDSITQGVNNSAQGDANPQYRTSIAAHLAANGYKPKFRGIWRYSDRNGANLLVPDDWAYHCGFGCAAIRTTESSGGLADNMPFYLDIAGYPDVITLLIGTNDLGMNDKGAAETFANYVALVNATAAQRPYAKIIGATLLPRPGEAGEKAVAFNALLTTEYAKSGKGDLPDNFFLLDLYPLVPNDVVANNVTGNYADDNLHPNWKGHAIIAEAFYGKIAELLPLATFAGAGDATVTDAEQVALGAESISDLADYRSGMTHVFTIEKDGVDGANNCFTSAPYTATNATILLSRPVSKVGYFMELVRKGTPPLGVGGHGRDRQDARRRRIPVEQREHAAHRYEAAREVQLRRHTRRRAGQRRRQRHRRRHEVELHYAGRHRGCPRRRLRLRHLRLERHDGHKRRTRLLPGAPHLLAGGRRHALERRRSPICMDQLGFHAGECS